MDPWLPEWDVSEKVLREEAELHVGPLQEFEKIGEGWDNLVYSLGQNRLIRFAKRKIAEDLMRTEVLALRHLAHTPLSAWIPPIHSWKERGDRYPHSYYLSSRIPGREAVETELSPRHTPRLADDLGAFLRNLHGQPPPDFLPGDELDRLDPLHRGQRLREKIEDRRDLYARHFEPSRLIDFALSSWPTPDATRVFVHGDLNFRHVFVREGRLTGVIDWGDVHVNHPAQDLGIAWALFEQADRERFFAACGREDASSLQLGRFKAFSTGVYMLDYAVGIRSGSLERASVLMLKRCLS